MKKETEVKENMFVFEGAEYPLFPVAKRGAAAVPILDSEREVTGKILVEFEWDKKDDLLAALDYETSEVDDGEKIVVRGNDTTMLNAAAFRETAQRGVYWDFEDGEFVNETKLTRDQLCNLEEEMQSWVLKSWIESIHISEWSDATSKLDALFRNKSDSIYLVGKIGKKEAPNAVIKLEFAKPSIDLRREMRKMKTPSTKNENGKTVTTYPNTTHFRMQQFAKHLRSVEGVYFEQGVTAEPKAFASNFNPIWAIYFVDALFGSFNKAGK